MLENSGVAEPQNIRDKFADAVATGALQMLHLSYHVPSLSASGIGHIVWTRECADLSGLSSCAPCRLVLDSDQAVLGFALCAQDAVVHFVVSMK